MGDQVCGWSGVWVFRCVGGRVSRWFDEWLCSQEVCVCGQMGGRTNGWLGE